VAEARAGVPDGSHLQRPFVEEGAFWHRFRQIVTDAVTCDVD
jgi:hypothetical protein